MMALQKDKQKSAAEQRDSSHHGSGQQEQGGSEREVPPPSSTADVVREQLSACGGLSLHVHIHANAPFGSTEPTATAVVASTGQKAEVQATSAPVPPPPPAPPPVSVCQPLTLESVGSQKLRESTLCTGKKVHLQRFHQPGADQESSSGTVSAPGTSYDCLRGPRERGRFRPRSTDGHRDDAP
jgi:hypothetical protein